MISTCISTILRELELSTEPALSAILKTPWKDLENVSGRSAYVVDLVSSIKQVAEVVRSRIEGRKYIRNFADKAVGYVLSFSIFRTWMEQSEGRGTDDSVVITRFTGAVIKSRPLKRVGAEQVSPPHRYPASKMWMRTLTVVDPPWRSSGQSMSPRSSRTTSGEWYQYVSRSQFWSY